jgi:cytidylate kinase
MENDNPKKQIITIAGMLGSGKSSTAKQVAAQLGFTHYSAGDLMRQIGKEQGIEDIRAFNLASEGKEDFDRQVDERTKQLGDDEDRIVFDGHMSWHFVPQSFKVFLDIDPLVAARRVLAGMDHNRRVSEHIPDSPEEYAELLEERRQSNMRRYKQLYGVNPYSPELFDLVISTENNSLDEVVAEVIAKYRNWLG